MTRFKRIDPGLDIAEAVHHRATMLKAVGEVLADLNAHWVHVAIGKLQPEQLRATIGRGEDLIRNLSGLLIEQDRRLFEADQLAQLGQASLADAAENWLWAQDMFNDRPAWLPAELYAGYWGRSVGKFAEAVVHFLREESRTNCDALAKANETIRQMMEVVGQHEATVEFLTNDRTAIVAERNEAQEELRSVKAQVKVATEHNSSSKEAALAIEAAVADVRSVLKPSNIDALQKRDLGSLTAQEAAELALWETTVERGRLIRFIASLATMTDIEVEFFDAGLVREQARLLTMGEPAAIPPVYSEEDRKRAIDRIFGWSATSTRNCAELVDAVAEALGMRRAGE